MDELMPVCRVQLIEQRPLELLGAEHRDSHLQLRIQCAIGSVRALTSTEGWRCT